MQTIIIDGKTYLVDKNNNKWNINLFRESDIKNYSERMIQDHSYNCINSRNCSYSNKLIDCEGSYFCKRSTNLKNCQFIINSSNCEDSYRSSNCHNSNNLDTCHNCNNCSKLTKSKNCNNCHDFIYLDRCNNNDIEEMEKNNKTRSNF